MSLEDTASPTWNSWKGLSTPGQGANGARGPGRRVCRRACGGTEAPHVGAGARWATKGTRDGLRSGARQPGWGARRGKAERCDLERPRDGPLLLRLRGAMAAIGRGRRPGAHAVAAVVGLRRVGDKCVQVQHAVVAREACAQVRGRRGGLGFGQSSKRAASARLPSALSLSAGLPQHRPAAVIYRHVNAAAS